ncbi:MAG: phosphotransferase family protein [Acidimicrobiia bacterium]
MTSSNPDLQKCQRRLNPEEERSGFFMSRSAFPDLPRPFVLLDTGFGSTAFETADGVIVRIGRHPEAAEGHQRERALLPVIASKLPLKVPQPEWYALSGSPGLPFGAIGYRKIEGVSVEEFQRLDQERIAGQLAEFLAVLHELPTGDVQRAVGRRDLKAEYERLQGDVLPTLRERLTEGEFVVIERWWESVLSDPVMESGRRVLCHRDLWYGNILIDKAIGELVAVVDWENAALADPAEDLAVQRYLGGRFQEAVLGAYRGRGGQVGDTFELRLDRYWELREFNGIRHSVEMHDTGELGESIEKLRRGPILRSGTA